MSNAINQQLIDIDGVICPVYPTTLKYIESLENSVSFFELYYKLTTLKGLTDEIN